MKRGIIPFVFASIIVLSACSSSSGNTTELEKKISALESQVSTLTEENKKLKETPHVATDVVAKEAENTTVSKLDESLKISKGTPVTIEGAAEIKITNTKFTKKVEPSSPGSFYNYYEAKEADNTYLVVTAKLKNLKESAKEARDLVSVKVKYDNKYEYNSLSIVENGDGSDFNIFSPIDPLSSKTVIFLTEVPKEIENGDKSIIAEFSINGETYMYTIR